MDPSDRQPTDPGPEPTSPIESEPGPGPIPDPGSDDSRNPNIFPYATWGPLAGLAATLPFFLLALASIGGDSGADEISSGVAIGAQLIQASIFIAVPAIIAAITGAGDRLVSFLDSLGFRRFRFWHSLKLIALGAVLYYACLFTTALLMDLLGIGKLEQDDISSQFGSFWVQVLLIAVLAPISEEIFFRGLLFGGLRRRMGPYLAALISGTLFGMMHAPTGPSAVIPLIVFGIVLALVYERTGSLWPAIGLHSFNNAIALIAINST